MSRLNKVILIGLVGRAVKISTLRDGKTVANCSVATLRSFSPGSIRDWHYIEAWEELATDMHALFQVGYQVFVEGRLRTYQYERDGVLVRSTRVIARKLELLSDFGRNRRTDHEHE